MPNSLKTDAQKRWVSNAMFLCDALDKFRGKPQDHDILGDQNTDTTEAAIDKMSTKLIEYLNGCIVFIQASENPEIQQFYLSCKGDDGNIDPTRVNAQINMLANCLGHYSRKIASKIRHKFDDQGKKLADTEGLHGSMLGKILKINYLNRVACGFAEDLAEERKDKTITDTNGRYTFSDINSPSETALLNIYINAQRAKSSTFDTPFDEALNNITLEKAGKIFSKAQNSPKSPFNKGVHRRRKQTPGTISSSEAYLLPIGSGGSITNVANDSTLGLVQKALNLPERCDISGTTTDAVGAAITLCATMNEFDDEAKKYMIFIYVFSCITAMCLSGHHSLSEMGAAASLWSSTTYNPLTPISVILVILLLFNHNRQVTDSQHITNTLDTSPEFTEAYFWHSNTWLSLVGSDYQDTIDYWKFNDKNWKVWKMFSSAINADS